MKHIIILSQLLFIGLSLLSQNNSEISARFPEEIEGNWFRSDGSGSWLCGFHDSVVIWNSEIYKKVEVTKKGRQYQLVSRDSVEEIILYIKGEKKGTLRIGIHPDRLEVVSREPLYRQEFHIPDDNGFQSPILKRDTAICKGFLKGISKNKSKSGKLEYTDILTGKEEVVEFLVAEDESFITKIPMNYPQEVRLSVAGRMRTLFLEPGTTIFCFLDVSASSFASREKTLLFMGTGARLNDHLQVTSKIRKFDMNAVMRMAKNKSWEEYKSWCLSTLEEEYDSLDQFYKIHPISKKAQQIRHLSMTYRAYQLILSYPEMRNTALVMIGKSSKEVITKPEGSFFSFLSGEELNEDKSLMAGMAYYDLLAEISTFIPSSGNYNGLIRDLKDSLGIQPGLISDILFSQQLVYTMEEEMRSLSHSKLESARTHIISPLIADNLVQANKKQEEKLQAQRTMNESKTGYYIVETPEYTDDRLLEAIINQFPGKVIFIDFWATWCAPCKVGIERMQPLKQEYRDQDVVFLYITDPSSPVNTWEMMVPSIKGYHYRLASADYKMLYKRYNIKYIPRYMMVDKSGKLVSDDLGSKGHSNSEIKTLIDQYLR